MLVLEAPLKPGDGVVFDAGSPDEKEEAAGFMRSEGKAKLRNADTLLSFGQGDIDFTRIHVGDKVWKTSDPELDRRLRQSFEGDAPNFGGRSRWKCTGAAGQAADPDCAAMKPARVAQVDSAMPLAEADKQPLTTERLREQLGRLGGTPFRLGELKNFLAGERDVAGQRTEPPAPRSRGGTGKIARADEAVDAEFGSWFWRPSLQKVRVHLPRTRNPDTRLS